DRDHRELRPGRAQLGRLRLAPADQAALVWQSWTRLAGRRVAERHAARGHAQGPAFRLSLLPPGRHPRSRVRQEPLLLRVHAAGAAAILAAALCFFLQGAAAEEVPRKAQACVACHGPGGNSTDPAMPSLAGQPAQFISLQLFMFREGNRKDPQMSPMAASLSNADMNELAAYFSRQKPAAASHE